MGTLLQSYAEHLVASILVFLLLFISIAFLFAGKRFFSMLNGFGCVIISFFSCPFSYLRAAVLSMAEYRERGENQNSYSKQYLLNKLMLFMQAALILVSIAIFSGSVITGWNAMLPPKPLRDAIRELNLTVVKQKADLQRLEPAIKQLDEAWKNQRDAEINNFTTDRTKKIEQLEKDNIDLANKINNIDPQTKMLFAKIEEFQTKNAGNSNVNALTDNLNTLNIYMDRLHFTDEAQALIRTYNSNWGMQLRSKIEISNLSEKEVRAAAQPTYEDMSKQLSEIIIDLPVQEQQLIGFKTQATYNTRSLFLNILYGGIMFILIVWLFGLIIEALWSTINISSDVKKIQDALSKTAN